MMDNEQQQQQQQPQQQWQEQQQQEWQQQPEHKPVGPDQYTSNSNGSSTPCPQF